MITLSGAIRRARTLTLTDERHWYDHETTMRVYRSADASTSGGRSSSLEFTVTLSPVDGFSGDGELRYFVDADSGSGHATAGSDYTAITATTLTFAAGATGSALSQTITVQVMDDAE